MNYNEIKKGVSVVETPFFRIYKVSLFHNYYQNLRLAPEFSCIKDN